MDLLLLLIAAVDADEAPVALPQHIVELTQRLVLSGLFLLETKWRKKTTPITRLARCEISLYCSSSQDLWQSYYCGVVAFQIRKHYGPPTIILPVFGLFDLRYALLHGGVLLLNSGKKVFQQKKKKRTFSYPGDEFALLGEAEVKVSGLGANVDLAVGTDRRQFDISCNERKMLCLLKHSLRASLSS